MPSIGEKRPDSSALKGEATMADNGKNDKGKKEQKKKPKLTIKEKRKAKNEKKNPSSLTGS